MTEIDRTQHGKHWQTTVATDDGWTGTVVELLRAGHVVSSYRLEDPSRRVYYHLNQLSETSGQASQDHP